MEVKMARAGDWIQTFTGGAFWPLDPRVEDIRIEDIAHALSMLCRYNGHCTRFYSVAEHSVYVSRLVAPEHRLAALLHDASEAYLADVPRPVKPLLQGYAEIEAIIERKVAERFGLVWPWAPEIKQADLAVFHDEKNQIMAPEPAPWKLPVAAAGVSIVGLDSGDAKMLFLAEYDQIRSTAKAA
jgi:hypothetical protein